MLVTELAKMAPTAEQASALLDTMRACNAATNRAAEIAHREHTSSRVRVHPLCYYELREKFDLSAQMAVRAISKACGAAKREPHKLHRFRPLGAVAYDSRILAWHGRDRVSILTLSGRIEVPIVYRGHWLHRDQTTTRGQVDLIYRDSKFYLAVVIDVPEPPAGPTPDKWLGVDLGIVNIATDSDGERHSGKALRAIRRRNRTMRARLQAKNTKSATRLLRKRRRKEARHARDVNHVISKRLVGKAQDTGRGIALEDLKGIRGRTTVRKGQRDDHAAWAFYQLRRFIAYKAKLAGVTVVAVDPRNTSRACPDCGHIDKRNRRTRDDFRCVSCGFAGPADHIAATNIGRRAAVVQPDAA